VLGPPAAGFAAKVARQEDLIGWRALEKLRSANILSVRGSFDAPDTLTPTGLDMIVTLYGACSIGAWLSHIGPRRCGVSCLPHCARPLICALPPDSGRLNGVSGELSVHGCSEVTAPDRTPGSRLGNP